MTFIRRLIETNVLYAVDEMGNEMLTHATAQDAEDHIERTRPGETVDWDTTKAIHWYEAFQLHK